MAQTETAAEMEMDVDSFDLNVDKPVGAFKPEQVKQKVDQKNSDGTVGLSKMEASVVQSLDEQVDQITQQLMTAKSNSAEFKDITSALNVMGDAEIDKTSRLSSSMLSRRSVKSMKDNKYGEGDSVAAGLSKLRQTVVDLDPSQRGKLFSRDKIFGIKLPFGLGKKVDSYFQEYKSAETQLQDIVKALNNGKDQLLEDNAFIDEDREQMQNMMRHLEQYVYVIKKIDEKIEARLPEIEAVDRMKAEDIRQEILFPVRQKQTDILQHLAVSMQGYMALQVLKRNNLELIRGVDRATKTTIAALRTAVTVSEALGTQKLVLDQISSLNSVTNSMIESTSLQLGKQGLEIQKQATESAVNVATLEKAFANIFKAMDAMDKYRSEALPNMKKTIDSLQSSVDNAQSYLSNRREEKVADFTQEVLEEVAEPTQPDDGAVKIRKTTRKAKA